MRYYLVALGLVACSAHAAPINSLLTAQNTLVLSSSAVLCGDPMNIFGGAGAVCAGDGAQTLIFTNSTPGTVDFVFFKTTAPIQFDTIQLSANGDLDQPLTNGGLPREVAEFRFDLVNSSNQVLQTLVDVTPPHPEATCCGFVVSTSSFSPVTGQYFRAEFVQGAYALTGPRIDAVAAALSTPEPGAFAAVLLSLLLMAHARGLFTARLKVQPLVSERQPPR